MPSLDFIYDITEKLDEEEIEYLVLAIRTGKREDKVDVFFRVKKETKEVFNASLDQVKEIIADRDDEDSYPKRPKRRKKRK
jgi:hypothetical protein|tara:strand:+ start:127 stop:369 length:243 start_codon:yes stop_codon:yes gene_type:complete